MTSSPAPEEAIRLLARIAEMHSDQAPDSLVLWCDNARQPETILTLGHARAIAAWNRRAGGEREAWLPIESAPKDRFIWLWCPEDNSRWLAKWQDGQWYGVDGEGLTRACGYHKDSGRVTGWEITHWQPLPAPPRAALAGQTEGERNGG